MAEQLLLDPNDPVSLTYYAKKSKSVETFFLDTFFSKKEKHEHNTIWYERKSSVRNLANFVSERAEKPIPIKHNFSVDRKQFKLARTFEMKSFSQYQLERMTPIDKKFAPESERNEMRMEVVADEIDDLKARVLNRMEQLACSAVLTGKITVNDADSEPIDYDFGYEAGKHLVALSTKWTDPNADPILDLRRYTNIMMDHCDQKPDLLIMGRDVTNAFLNNAKVQRYLDTLNYKVGNIDINKQEASAATAIAQMIGLKFVEYSQKYTNKDGSKAEYFPANGLLLASNQANVGIQHTGVIFRVDDKGKFVPVSSEMYLYPKINDEKTQFSWSLDNVSVPMIHEPDAFISFSNVL